jgi:hypothetical protein
LCKKTTKKNKYCIALLQLLFESGFKKAEDLKSSRSKIGQTIQLQKAASFLKVAIRMSKMLNALIKSASNDEKMIVEQMLNKVRKACFFLKKFSQGNKTEGIELGFG